MEDELIEILSAELLESPAPLNPDSDLFAAGLDSMGIMQLILAIEDRFGTVIDPSELSRDNFTTVSRISRLVRSKQANEDKGSPTG